MLLQQLTRHLVLCCAWLTPALLFLSAACVYLQEAAHHAAHGPGTCHRVLSCCCISCCCCCRMTAQQPLLLVPHFACLYARQAPARRPAWLLLD
jgi:hypothetical protein